MATNLTEGTIYFIESESTNQDWITNNAGDPDAIDLDNFTNGLDYVSLPIPKNILKLCHAQILNLRDQIQRQPLI